MTASGIIVPPMDLAGLAWHSNAASLHAVKATAGDRMTGASGWIMDAGLISPWKVADTETMTVTETAIVTAITTVMDTAATTGRAVDKSFRQVEPVVAAGRLTRHAVREKAGVMIKGASGSIMAAGRISRSAVKTALACSGPANMV